MAAKSNPELKAAKERLVAALDAERDYNMRDRGYSSSAAQTLGSAVRAARDEVARLGGRPNSVKSSWDQSAARGAKRAAAVSIMGDNKYFSPPGSLALTQAQKDAMVVKGGPAPDFKAAAKSLAERASSSGEAKMIQSIADKAVAERGWHRAKLHSAAGHGDDLTPERKAQRAAYEAALDRAGVKSGDPDAVAATRKASARRETAHAETQGRVTASRAKAHDARIASGSKKPAPGANVMGESLPKHVARFGEKYAVKTDKKGQIFLAKRGEKTPVSADAVKGLEAWDAYKARQAGAKASKPKAAKAPKPTIDTSGVKTAALKGAPSHEIAASAGVNARKPEMLAKIEFGNSKPTAQQLDAFREVHGHTVKTASGFKFKSTWYSSPTTAGGQPMEPLAKREARYTAWLKAGKPKTGPSALGLGLLAPVGIAAAMLAASNEAKAAGGGATDQIKAAGAEGARSVGMMAAFIGGTTVAAKGLMAAGLTAARAMPVVQGAMIAGGAIHGAMMAKPGERLAGAAKGAWDMSLPGMVVNTGKAVGEAVSGRFGPDKAAAFDQANATWQAQHGSAEQGMANASGQQSWQTGLNAAYEARMAAAGKPAENLPFENAPTPRKGR